MIKKNLILTCLAILISVSGYTQITGIQTVPGSYPTLEAAVTALNSAGVGSGGATIIVAAGHTETLTASLVLTMSTNSPTAANPLVIQKSGAGANPLITAHTGIGTLDGIFILNGVDYVTIDGISLQENAANATTATQMEWGFALLKTSATNGASFNTIKNCVITLNKTNTASTGIYSANHTTAALTALSITANGGTNSYNRFLSNTIQNVYIGYTVNGFASAAPYDFYDQNNQIGKDAVSGNSSSISNFGGAAVAAAGIQTSNQNYIRVFGTNINGGTGTTAALSGISIGAATNANVDIYNDTITLVSAGTTAAVNGITNAAGGTGAGSVINIYNNVVSNCVMSAATTLEFRGIASTSTASYTNIYNNTVSNNTQAGTGQFSGIYYSGSSATLCLLVNIYGNTVNNNTKTGTAGQFNCIFANGSTNTTNVFNNTMSNNNNSTSSGATYGYYNFGLGYNENIYNNTVNDLLGGSGDVRAIYASSGSASAPTNKEVYGNTIFNISGNTATTVVAIFTDYGAYTNIYKNRIYNIINNTATGAAPASAGIILSGNANASTNIYNNYVSDIKAPNATNAAVVISGIHLLGSTTSTVNAFNNTVYLNATGTGAAFNTAALFFGTAPVNVDLRNNILVNVSTPNGTGVTSAITRGAAGLTNYSLSSGYNCLFAGTPSATNVLFYDGTTGYQTLQAFKNVLSPREQASFSSLPPFVNIAVAPYDLHLQTSVATGCESGGFPTSLVTVDYDGDSRNASTPDVGADEFAGVGVDNASPNIQYTLLGNGNVAANRPLGNFATITDLNGINSSAGTKPRLYYKKSTQANTYNDNTNGTDGWKYVEASNAASPFSFTIDYSILFSGSVVAGDIIQYFVVAQDLNGTPNFGINAGGLTVQPASVNLAAANFPLLNTINQYTIVANALSGTINVGPTETITSLTNAGGLFQTVNAATLTGNLTVNITGDLTAETGTFALNQWPEVGTGNYSMTIVPSAAVTRLISGTSATAMIRFDGADRVTVDGRFGGSGRFLTFRSTSTAAPVISYLNDAQNNNLQYTIVESGNTATSTTLGGAIYIGTTVATGTGNDNISINNNEIRDRSDVVGTPSIAINCVGNNASTLAAYNNNVTISNNDIHDWFVLNGTVQFAVNVGVGNSGFTISNNSFYQTATRTHTAAGAITRAINISFASTVNSNGGHIITGNFIGGTAPGATGGDMTSTAAFAQTFVGIAITTGLIPNTIQNNTIRNISFTTNAPTASASMWLGISVAQGNYIIDGNTIGTDLATNNIKININAGGAFNSFLAGVLASGSAGSFTIQNNKIGGINVGGTTVTGPIIPQWIQVQGTPNQTVNVSNNLIGSTTVANSISYTSAANVISFGFRYLVTSGAAVNFTGNSIQNISDNSTGTGSIHYGAIFISTVGGSGLVNANNNIIRDLSQNATAATPAIGLVAIAFQNYIGLGHNINNNTIAGLNVINTGAFQNYAVGIQLQSNALGGTVSQNRIFGFRNSNTGAIVGLAGIYINSGLDWTISNNMISLSNGANTNNIDLTGITELMGQTGNLSLYYNSIYLGGSVTAGATNSAAFFRGSLSKATVKNNLFYNERSGGTGAHLALSNNNALGWSSNNNALIVGDTTKVGALAATNYDFATWKSTAGSDLNSISTSSANQPSAALFVNANAGDLHINTSIYPQGYAVPLPGLTIDYDGNTRNATAPTIGADEIPCTAVIANISTQTNVLCNGDSNGQATVSAVGGNGISYIWPSIGATTNTVTGLSAGVYSCIASNLCGNSATVVVTITQPATALSATSTSTNVSCFGDATGAIDLTATGGTIIPPGNLLTSFANNNGAAGNMFDVTLNNTTTTITGFDVNLSVNASVFFYYRTGTMVGNQTNSAGWIFGGSVPVIAAGAGVGTNVVLPTAITLPAGTYGFYVGSYSGGFNYINGTAFGGVWASNADMTIFQGNGTSQSSPGNEFAITLFTPRNFSGRINYTTSVSSPPTYLWSNGATTQDIATLTAGNYTVTVTDANGCSTSSSATITEPAIALSSSNVVTNVLCNGGATGAIDLTAAGGTGAYTFNWGGGITSEDRNGLSAGTYSVTVSDANGCTTTSSATITEPATALSASNVVTNILCNGDLTGAIDLTATGGTGAYSFNWGGGVTTEDLNGLTAGNYSVTITDANGCTTTSSVTISQPATALSASNSAVGATCIPNSGSATVTASGGTGAYSFVWSNSVTTANNPNLNAGAYNVTVTDANGCSTTSLANVADGCAGCNLIASNVFTNVLCNGESTGSIDLTPLAGTAPYTYNWGGGVTTQDLTGLAVGTYTVTVTDVNGCTTTSSATITEPSTALSASNVVTNILCNGDLTGAINLTATGGTGAYTYNWDGGLTTEDLNGLSDGTYSVTITDANGCTTTSSATITEPATALSASSTSTNVSCNGSSNGTVTVNVNGGTAPYSFDWGGGVTTQNITGLVAGTYTVSITDANGCTALTSSTVGTNVSNISVSYTSTDITFNGGNDGTIDITVLGGTAPITYLWSNGATTEDLNGLTQGNYTVTITDGNGCVAIETVIISAPVAISLTAANSWNANIFPNPAEYQTMVAVELNAVSNVRIRLVNSLGQIIKTAEYTDVINVQHSLNIAELPAAIYMIEISANGITETLRLVITRK